MVATLTPRVGYTIDPVGQIGVQHANWDRADQVSGLIYTTSGVTPPNSVLYDGAVVSEKDTGISYRTFSDGLGGFTKKYVSYPYYCKAQGHTSGVGAGTPGKLGWNELFTAENVNNNDSWISPANGFFKPQVKAQYILRFHYRWLPYTSNSFRGMGFYKNSVPLYQDYQIERAALGAPYPLNGHLEVNLLLVPGDEIACYLYNNSGDVNDAFYTIEASIVRPVW